MKKALQTILVLSSFLAAACSVPGFDAGTQKSATGKSHKIQAPVNAVSELAAIADNNADRSGSISLAGVALTESNDKLQMHSQLSSSRTAMKSTSVDFSHLDSIGKRMDFVQIGCGSSSPLLKSLPAGLSEAPLAAEEVADTLELKARVVLLCGRIQWPQSYVSIIADLIILSDVDYEMLPASGIGFISIYANKLTLLGANQITTKGKNSSTLVLEGPALNLAVQKEIVGKGSLSLKTISGQLVQIGKISKEQVEK